MEVPEAVPLERNFEGHYPAEEIALGREVREEKTFSFEGIGFAAAGEACSKDGGDHVLEAELYVDGKRLEKFNLSTNASARRFIPVYRYELRPGRHQARRASQTHECAQSSCTPAVLEG